MFWLPFMQNDLTRLISRGIKPVKKVEFYNQGDTKLCTFFACASCIAFNTGKVINKKEILEYGKDHIIAWIAQTARSIAEANKLTVYKVDLMDWLKRGNQWAIIVSLSVEPTFYTDGFDNGVVNKVPNQKIGNWHAVCLYRKDKRIFLINSWWEKNGYFEYDITDVLLEMIKNKSIKKEGIIVA